MFVDNNFLFMEKSYDSSFRRQLNSEIAEQTLLYFRLSFIFTFHLLLSNILNSCTKKKVFLEGCLLLGLSLKKSILDVKKLNTKMLFRNGCEKNESKFSSHYLLFSSLFVPKKISRFLLSFFLLTSFLFAGKQKNQHACLSLFSQRKSLQEKV